MFDSFDAPTPTAYRDHIIGERFMRYLVACLLLTSIGCAATTTTSSSSLSAGDQLLTIDHYVRVRSTAPSMNGQTAQIYVRERVESRNIQRGSSGVVLFVHGAGTPAEVAFDVPSGDYSWMAYLARAGFDVFSMDMTGYGRSTRPTVMNDPCNLTGEQQAAFIPSLLAAPCAPTFTQGATTIASDWNDLDAVVEYIRMLRRADRVNMVAWSLGGPRAGGYAAQHADKVQRLVLLAPAYNRTAPENPPAARPDGTHEHAVAPGARQRSGTVRWGAPARTIKSSSTVSGRACSNRTRLAQPGVLACAALPKRRRGAGMPGWLPKLRLLR